MNNVYLGIGGNLGDRVKNIKETLNLIGKYIAQPEKISNFYISEPWGFYDSKYFLNAVVNVKTDLSAYKILKVIRKIEKKQHRKHSNNGYENRTADIDILFFNSEIIQMDNLSIPHPKIQDRLFVLLPLNDICPEFVHPQINLKISQLINICPDKSKIRKINLTKKLK